MWLAVGNSDPGTNSVSESVAIISSVCEEPREKRFKGKEELPVTGRTLYHQIHHRNRKKKKNLLLKKNNLILCVICLSIKMFLYILFFGSRSFLLLFREIKPISSGKFLRNFKNNLKALCWIFTCPAGKVHFKSAVWKI